MINQRYLPHHFLTRCMGIFLNSKIRPLKNWQINKFIRVYQINMSEAEKETPQEFRCFNEFFARTLKQSARPIEDGLISPCDGVLSDHGEIKEGTLIQAKKFDYLLQGLLADHKFEPFTQGSFLTFYLAPADYHRVHAPFDGTLKEIVHVPGRLFSVNQETVSSIPNIYARNERAIFHFDTEFGPAAVIMVGAMLVGSIETHWTKKGHPRKITHTQVTENITKGQDLGCFKFGSTVIVLLPNALNINKKEGDLVKMGQTLA